MARQWLVFTVVLTLGAGFARAGGIGCALSELKDQSQFDALTTKLRSQGPDRFQELLAYYDERLAEAAALQAKLDADFEDKDTARSLDKANADLQRLRDVVDHVAGQRDATVSRLYWYTDLDEAKTAAADSGKPILSLRMLGKLTDELSCANSRYFRTALYANKEISDYLREHYVLHWQSVRPVPRVTIDFGDGRKLERTVTGNSAHYVLDATARPLDALPGLYGPRQFLDWLKKSAILSDQLAESDPSAFGEIVAQHHGYALASLDADLHRDLASVNVEPSDGASKIASTFTAAKLTPNALRAASRAAAKTVAEAPIVRQILPWSETLVVEDEETWSKIAALHRPDAALDAASVEIIRREHPNALAAGALSESKRRVEDPILRVVRNFEEAIALDTVKNEYLLHRQIHRWFISGSAPTEIEPLNEKVYAELFLTPSTDPWLGLAPADVYTALDRGGLAAAP